MNRYVFQTRTVFSYFIKTIVLGILLQLAVGVYAKTSADAQLNTITVAQLPKEAKHTLSLIQAGGPFPYAAKDGSTFGNREGTLPKKPRGYYSEFTVKTPGSRDRGARRIVAGKGATGDPKTSGEYFYTDDHYASFKRIVLNP